MISLDRLKFLVPDRSGLPPLREYAHLLMPGGERRIAGYTEASRGCKHLCRHCPIVPVYNGVFRIVPREIVLEDIRRQVDAGAEHIAFGDPDFFNGPAHALSIVEALHREFPRISYDVIIKIEHLLRSPAEDLAKLRDTGCLFVTSAVESLDDAVLARLDKGHTRADFLSVVQRFRALGLVLQPTFVPFTPWTTLASYRDLLEVIAAQNLIENVAPIQLGIRLLIPAGSRLLELRRSARPGRPVRAQRLGLSLAARRSAYGRARRPRAGTCRRRRQVAPLAHGNVRAHLARRLRAAAAAGARRARSHPALQRALVLLRRADPGAVRLASPRRTSRKRRTERVPHSRGRQADVARHEYVCRIRANPGSRLLLLASKLGYQTRSFAEAAKRLGVEVVIGSDRCHQLDDPWSDGAIPLHFEEPEQAAARLVEAVRDRPVRRDSGAGRPADRDRSLRRAPPRPALQLARVGGELPQQTAPARSVARGRRCRFRTFSRSLSPSRSPLSCRACIFPAWSSRCAWPPARA